jgi:hypothetical protein
LCEVEADAGRTGAYPMWTFSRAFAEFSDSQLPERVHESLIKKSYKAEIVGHNSRDSTAIEAREKPLKKENVKKVAKKRGRPKKGEERIKEPTRLEKQAAGMGLSDMLDKLVNLRGIISRIH